ncbi:hypothetical protein [Tautonia rosea]|uniref:hypothetical protein n=1 Tax=Tautonia rosea TaxID=2728037 RepID=UPI0014745C0A|nr:hypothetical protein [Tautonia rosea]
MSIPKLIAMIGTIVMGAWIDGPPSSEVSAGPSVAAFDVPVSSGFATFEIPEELSDHEVLLIVSAMATEGSFASRCSMIVGQEGPRPPNLRTLSSLVSVDILDSPNPIAINSAAIGELSRLDRPAATGNPVLRRGFSVRVRPGDPRAPSNYDLVDARLRAVGERIQVFVDDDDLAIVSDEVLRTLVSSFDRIIEPRLAQRIGTAVDVDRDGRFTVLLSRRISLPFPHRSQVDGYFRATDLDPDLPRPLSNRADMIYLNAELQPGPYLETVLAHEFAHAVLESRRRELGGPFPEESWLDEAMAHLCEDLVGQSTSNLDYRVSAFLSEPNRACVIVEDEHRPGRFRSHGNRGASYLFLRWCAERLDEAFLLRLCTQGEVGVSNLERATGILFSDLYRRWTITNALQSLGMTVGGENSFQLLGRLGDWRLGGVRFAIVGQDTPEHSFTLEGTSSQYLRLSLEAGRSTRVSVQCDSAALPQVTVLLGSRKHPNLRFEVQIEELGPDVATLVAQIEERAGLTTTLEHLSWEPRLSTTPLTRSGMKAQVLHGVELQSLFSKMTIAPGDRLTSAPFHLPTDQLHSTPLIFRLETMTDDGNRSVSWTDLFPPPPAPPLRPTSLERP